MALRLRRGTDAERQIITPVEGELVYVTDTKELYIGDGTTVGGLRVTGEIADTLDGLTDVDAALPQDGDILVYDSLTSEWESVQLPLVDLPDVNADGIADGQVLAWDSDTQAFVPANNQGGADSFVGDVVGSIFADDSTILLDAQNRFLSIDNIFVLNNIDANTMLAQTVTSDLIGDVTGDVSGNVTGNLTGDVIGDVIGNVTGDVTGDVTGNLTGDVIGDVIGNVFGEVSGDVFGSVFGDDSSLIIDGINNTLSIEDITASTIKPYITKLIVGAEEGITDFRLESFQTRNRLNINTVDKTGDLSSYTGYYGTLNFGFEDATTDRSDATIRGAASDMRMAHDTVTTFISDESKYFTLKEGKFGFGTYTPEVKMDVRGPIRPGVYADTAARDAAIPTPTAGMMIFVTDGDGAGNPKFQGNTDGTIGGWADLN